jgi:hypothetical protein
VAKPDMAGFTRRPPFGGALRGARLVEPASYHGGRRAKRYPLLHCNISCQAACKLA